MDLKRFINTTFSSYISIHVPLPYTGRLCRFTLPASLAVYGQTFSTLALSSFRTIWWTQISKRLEMVRETLLSTLDSKPLLVWFGWKETYQKRISTVLLLWFAGDQSRLLGWIWSNASCGSVTVVRLPWLKRGCRQDLNSTFISLVRSDSEHSHRSCSIPG